MTRREALQHLVDELPEERLGTAEAFLRALGAGAAEDVADALAYQSALEEFQRSGDEPIPLAKVKADLGLA